jgi:hypothetical protein
MGFAQHLTEMISSRRKIMCLRSKSLPVLRADNITPVCEPIDLKMLDLNISQFYSPPLPVMGIALVFTFLLT